MRYPWFNYPIFGALVLAMVLSNPLAAHAEDGDRWIVGHWQGVLDAGSQQPRPPFPYAVDEVSLSNAEAGIELAGTVTRPRGEGPYPAVVLVSGAGPHDRDGSMAGHKPLLVLADHLARHGIVALRLDELPPEHGALAPRALARISGWIGERFSARDESGRSD